jgi:peroxiredoxin
MVLGVSNNDRREAMEAFALDEKLTYPIVIDGDNTVGVAYQVVGPPYTYFIDRAGVVVAVVSGELDEATLEENLTLLLN